MVNDELLSKLMVYDFILNQELNEFPLIGTDLIL